MLYYLYASNLLLLEGALRYPDWFRVGFAEVFAASKIEPDQVTIGGYDRNVVRPLTPKSFIPVRRLLRLHAADAELKSSTTLQIYHAECWLLVHLFMLDGQYQTEFTRYLAAMDAGKPEEDAFAASFNLRYEDLDQALLHAFTEGRIHEVRIKVNAGPEGDPPHRLTEGEAKGRLAWAGARFGHDPQYATKLAQEALSLEPTNDVALRALAYVQLTSGEYVEALQSLRQPATNALMPPDAAADRARLLSDLARSNLQPPGNTVSGDAAPLKTSLLKEAVTDYQQAVSGDPQNVGYWTGLLDTVAMQRDRASADAILPKAERVFYLHTGSPALAKSLALLNVVAGHFDDALKFGVAWHRLALTNASRDEASEFVTRMNGYLTR